MDFEELQPWSVSAVNLPDHARNPIHTDTGAHAAGFPRALVAGVSVYAYLTHVPVAAWGPDWISHGGAEVRFLAPVFDGDRLLCRPTDGTVTGVVGESPRATTTVWTDGSDPHPAREGEALAQVEIELGEDWGALGARLGDELSLYRDEGIVHPATWPSLANDVVHNQLVTGSWIHTRSRIQHHDLARVGGIATIDAVVVDRFETRMGERAVLDVSIHVDGRPVATLEHEAIVSVRD